MDEFIQIGDGATKQFVESVPFGAEFTTFMPHEVGDYSIYVHRNLDGLYQIGINSNNGKTYISKEILTSSKGSVVYFDEKITPNIKEGFIYTGWIQKYCFDIHKTAEELFREGILTLEQLLNIYKNTSFKQITWNT
jgi:hypothetical protein